MNISRARVVTKLVGLPRAGKRAVLVLVDILCVLAAFGISDLFWRSPLAWSAMWPAIALMAVAIPLGFYLTHVYRSVVRFLSPVIILRFIFVCMSVGWLAYLMGLIFGWGVPGRIVFDVGWLTLVMALTARLSFIQLALGGSEVAGGNPKRVMIYGAGAAGRQLKVIFATMPEFRVMAFIDDDPALRGVDMMGVPVIGYECARKLVGKKKIQEVVLAMPSASNNQRRKIVERLETLPVAVRSVPALANIVNGKQTLAHLENVSAEELLGRDPIEPDPELMAALVENRVVMVTGAGGTIGGELCRQILAYCPQTLVLFELCEHSLYQIERELRQLVEQKNVPIKLVPVLGSVRDRRLMADVLAKHAVKLVYHAAAYKHVPLVECNVFAGIENNVMGTMDAASVCLEQGVDAFVMISTDKAVRPTNVMGASKRLAELAVQSLANEAQDTKFCIVRFGNVLKSSGSVVPLFHKQIMDGGPVTVTHPEVYRYFMTVTEATQLVLQATSLGEQGDVFVLDMGEPVSIYQLALQMIRLHGLRPKTEKNPEGDIEIVFSGLRPGEKLKEELLTESASPTRHSRILNCREPKLSQARFEAIYKQLEMICEARGELALRSLLLQVDAVGYKPAEVNVANAERLPAPAMASDKETGYLTKKQSSNLSPSSPAAGKVITSRS